MYDYHIFSPYCVCPIGAHIDHQQGPVTGLALDRGIEICFTATDNGIVDMRSNFFPTPVRINAAEPVRDPQNDWGDYLRGIIHVMQKEVRLEKGVTGVIRGSMPSGGIASSAALLCGFTAAIARANGLNLSQQQIVEISSMAERQFIGLNNGVLDQSCVSFCEKNQLLYLDTATGEHRLIPFGGQPGQQVPFKIVVFYSGVTHALVNTDYNLRVEECRAAAWMLQAYENRRLNRLNQTTLHQVSPMTYERYGKLMPARFASRARHFFTESERVMEGIEAWEAGDIEHFGELVFESCESSILNYECGSAELKTIYLSLRGCDGVYGARFCGAGFIGSCFALIDPEKEGLIRKQVASDYLTKFPLYRDSYRSFICESHHGLQFKWMNERVMKNNKQLFEINHRLQEEKNGNM